MGALHEGHLSLLRLAATDNPSVVASIFVNPTQFGAGEDFSRYPRDEAADLGLLETTGVDLAFVPPVEAIYPPGASTSVEVGRLGEVLEGAARPGHFRGVATVVTILFALVRPARAYFGQKDGQQAVVVRRLVRDLGLPLEVVVGPTVREPDGVAMSSRNVYLTPDERAVAPTLYRVLTLCAEKIAKGRPIATILSEGREVIERGGFALEYLEARHAETLAPVRSIKDGPVRLLVAAKLGKTRLIDNVGV